MTLSIIKYTHVNSRVLGRIIVNIKKKKDNYIINKKIYILKF